MDGTSGTGMPDTGASSAKRRGPLRLSDARVDLVEKAFAVVELEVVGEISVGFLARRPVEGHVQRDEASALGVVLPCLRALRGFAGSGLLVVGVAVHGLLRLGLELVQLGRVGHARRS